MLPPAAKDPPSSDDEGAADSSSGACLGPTAPEDRCLCALLARATRLRQLDGWQQFDEPQRAAGCGGGGNGVPPHRGDAGGRKPRIFTRDALAAASGGSGHDRVYEFKHRADDIGWYMKEYRDKCAKSTRQPAAAAARLPVLVATRQLASFRRPIRVPTMGDSRTSDESTAAGLQPPVTTPPRSRSSSSAEGGEYADGGTAAMVATAAGEPRSSRGDRSQRGLARSASMAVTDVSSTIAHLNRLGKSRSSSALERADVGPVAVRPLLLSRDPAAAASAAAGEQQPGFLTLEERSHRSAAAAAAASKARASRHRRAAGCSAGADGGADDAFVKEKQFVFPLPAKVRSLAAAGKASTRAGAQRQQAAAASAPPAPTPPARGRELGGGGGSSRLARTLGELIDDFRRERRSLAALGAAPELSVAAAAAAALAAAAARSGTSRRRARAGSRRKTLYYHLPLAGQYPYLGEMMDTGGDKGGGGVGRMAHAELFDFTSSAAAATSSRTLHE